MIYMGIDPGVEGAFALLLDDGQAIVFDTPVATVGGSRRDYLPAMMRIQVLAEARGDAVMAALERGIPMPNQSSRTTYLTGRGVGLWEGILTGLQIPYELVAPQRWKRALGLAVGADKGESRVLACRLFPALAQQLSRVRDHGRAEALLLAEWRHRQG